MQQQRRRTPLDLQSYIRKLPYNVCKKIANELDQGGTATNWKDFARKIPLAPGSPESKYTAQQIRKFESIWGTGSSPTLSVIDDWSTSNARVQDLIDVLMSLSLFSLVEMLKEAINPPPPYSLNSVASYPPRLPPRPPSHAFNSMQLNSTLRELPSYPLPHTSRSAQEQSDVLVSRPSYRRQPTENDSVPFVTAAFPSSLRGTAFDGYGRFDHTDKSKAQVLSFQSVSAYPYASLRTLTSGFDDSFKIGEGAFGSVFKGELPAETKDSFGASRTIAIKRLKMNDNPDFAIAIAKQFMEEIDVISQLEHENILPLVGYSSDERELCLVYDFMFNGSLSSHLDACRERRKKLTVAQRLEIGRGSAAGIAYLHEKKKIHRDIKSSNILLDSEMKPRISDFGLLRSKKNEQSTSTSTNNPIGTMVYMSPEACKGTVSYGMDVYSFGIVLLELLTGLAVMDESRDPSHIAMYIEEKCEEEDVDISKFFDELAGEWPEDVGQLLHGLSDHCLHHRHAKRPTMPKVLERLEELCKKEASQR